MDTAQILFGLLDFCQMALLVNILLLDSKVELDESRERHLKRLVYHNQQAPEKIQEMIAQVEVKIPSSLVGEMEYVPQPQVDLNFFFNEPLPKHTIKPEIEEEAEVEIASDNDIYECFLQEDYQEAFKKLQDRFRIDGSCPALLLPNLIKNNQLGAIKMLQIRASHLLSRTFLSDDPQAAPEPAQIAEAFRQLCDTDGIDGKVEFIYALVKIGWQPDEVSKVILFDLMVRHNSLELLRLMLQREWIDFTKELPFHPTNPLILLTMAGRETLIKEAISLLGNRFDLHQPVGLVGFTGLVDPFATAFLGDREIAPIPEWEDASSSARKFYPEIVDRLAGTHFPAQLLHVRRSKTFIRPHWSALHIAIANGQTGLAFHLHEIGARIQNIDEFLAQLTEETEEDQERKAFFESLLHGKA